MTLDITFEPDAEEIVMIHDNIGVLKASKGIRGEIIFDTNFTKLQEEDEETADVLKDIVRLLFKLAV